MGGARSGGSGEVVKRCETVLHQLALCIHQPQARCSFHLTNAGHSGLALRSSGGHGGAVLGRGGEQQLVVVTARQGALVQKFLIKLASSA